MLPSLLPVLGQMLLPPALIMNREQFFASLRNTEAGCYEWSRAKSSKGYGYLRFNGRDVRAHRLAFELAFGPIPDGFHVCHRCDNPPCCNPGHLFLGTAKDNHVDKVLKGRAVPQKGSRNNNSTLLESDVVDIRKMRESGARVNEIARQFKVHQTTITKIITRATWNHV